MPLPQDIFERFSADIQGVSKLIDFDREILALAVTQLSQLRESIVASGFSGVAQRVANTESMLRTVRENDSLRSRYQIIFNQAIVLLVSYFGSAIEDLFKVGVSAQIDRNEDSFVLTEEFRLSLAEIKERGWDLKESAADLIVAKRDLSFQDMQAIHRAFRDYLQIEIERNNVVENIILAQACRHVIVHSGGVATSKLIRQLRTATGRTLKKSLSVGELVQFSPNEVEGVSASMKEYVDSLCSRISEKYMN